jgi:hypothetical protein
MKADGSREAIANSVSAGVAGSAVVVIPVCST